MKIRQKIAMLLATAMVVTAVPAMTMAKSDFSLTNGIVTLEKDKVIGTEGKNQNLKIELKNGITSGSMFFVSLANAKWKDGATTNIVDGPTTIQCKKNSDTELQVTVHGNVVTNNTFLISLSDVELTGGDATVAVDGNSTEVSDMSPVVFAKTSDKKATVTFGDSKNIFKVGTIADVTIEEPLIGTMKNQVEITLELDNTDYQFAGDGSTCDPFTIEYSKGLSTLGKVTNVTGTYAKNGDDKSAITFKLPQASVGAPGRLKITNLDIKLKANKSFIENDDIYLTVKGDDITETSGKVAVAKELSCSIEMKDKKVVDIVAGKNEKVEFTVLENVNDSMMDRFVEVRIENAFFFDGGTTYSDLKANPSNTTAAEKQEMKITTKAANDRDYTAGGYNETYAGLPDKIDLSWVKDKDDKVIGFDFTIPAGTVRKNDIDKIVFKDVKIFAPLGNKGDVKITVAGRGIGSEISTVAANIIEPLEITNDQFTVKVGVKEQTGGKLVIKETDKARFQNNKDIMITFDNKDDGFEFTDKPVVKVVEGDLKLDLDKMVQKPGFIQIPVSRASKTASTIEITNFKVKVDRTVPQGKYDLKVDGPAIEPGCAMEALSVKDFLNVATANTEDISTNNGLRKGTAAFVIGSDKFLVNGIEQTMDAKAYLDPAGRTMVPLRFVANALGIEDTSIFYAQKTATIVAGSKTISLTLGDKLAKINGVPAKVMDVAPTMVNDRVYVPVGELANLLSVEAVWDGATQTATFTVK